MSHYSTFANDVSIHHLVELHSIDDIYHLIEQGVFVKDFYILGKGANSLFVNDYHGFVVKNMIMGKQLLSENDDEIIIEVGAGEDWEDFVLWTIDHGYLGLENLVGIPGSVGASPVQNIGAYGVELGDVVVSVKGVFLDSEPGKTKELSRDDCNFAYRDSIFKHELKGKFLITHVVFKLQKNIKTYNFHLTYKGIRDVMTDQNISESSLTQAQLAEIILSIRSSKLPNYKQLGTAGSFFKNPIVSNIQYQKLQLQFPTLVCFSVDDEHCKLSAGQLIDICGLKNYRIGSVGTYEKHALVLVNYGGASGMEIWEFAQMIQKKVQEQFSLYLEPEVNII